MCPIKKACLLRPGRQLNSIMEFSAKISCSFFCIWLVIYVSVPYQFKAVNSLVTTLKYFIQKIPSPLIIKILSTYIFLAEILWDTTVNLKRKEINFLYTLIHFQNMFKFTCTYMLHTYVCYFDKFCQAKKDMGVSFSNISAPGLPRPIPSENFFNKSIRYYCRSELN